MVSVTLFIALLIYMFCCILVIGLTQVASELMDLPRNRATKIMDVMIAAFIIFCLTGTPILAILLLKVN